MLLTALVRENWTALAAEKPVTIWGYRQGPVESMPQVGPASHVFLCKSPTSDVIEKIVQLQVVGTQRSNSWIISFQLRTSPFFILFSLPYVRGAYRSYSSECEVLPGARHRWFFHEGYFRWNMGHLVKQGIFQGLMLSIQHYG